ncbi:hypothetical protein [Aeromonas phage 4_4512]|nr:hypothetical protein [Aeromonas phage 4_4512]
MLGVFCIKGMEQIAPTEGDMTAIFDLNLVQDLNDDDIIPIGTTGKSTRGVTAKDAAKYFTSEIGPIVDEAKQAALDAQQSAESAEESAAEATAAAGVVGPQVREALRRSYAEAGYQLIGDFSDTGLVVTAVTDVVLWEPTGVAYAYSGPLPHTIGNAETTTGNPSWVAKAGALIRTAIGDSYSDDYNADPTGVVDATAALNSLFLNLGSKNCVIKPGTYLVNGDLFVKKVGNSFGTGGSISAYGVTFIGTGRLILDSVKRIKIAGISMPTLDLVLRGCWWAGFELMRFRDLIFSDVAGAAFSTNYWCEWHQCQFQNITTGAASTFNNKHDWYSCSMRGNTGQGFTVTRDYAFSFIANKNAQAWNFWGGDVSYHLIDIIYIDAANLTGYVELTFNGTYFDTLYPKKFSRPATKISTGGHFANDGPFTLPLRATSRGDDDAHRADRAVTRRGDSPINLIPNGDFKFSLSTWAGAGLPVGSTGGATLTEVVRADMLNGRGILITQPNLGVAGQVRIRPRPVPFAGQYTASLAIKNAPGAGNRNMRIGFNDLFTIVPVNDSEFSFYTLTSGADILSGAVPDIVIRADDDVSTYAVEVCYASVTFGSGGSTLIASPNPGGSRASATFDPPPIPALSSTFTDIPVSGAAIGDFVRVSFGRTLNGCIVGGEVATAGQVRVTFFNPTAAAVDLQSSTIRISVEKYI